MIFNQWYVIAESKEIGAKKPIKMTRLNQVLTLWRDLDGKVCCISDRCCHRGVSLSCGCLVDGQVQCPFHGFLFNGEGAVTLIPANGKNAKVPDSMHVKSYSIYENHDLIWMWWGDEDKKTEKPFFFEELSDYSYGSFKDEWNVHYSRAIENQLDVVHLPFVHASTIGRGNATLVNGPVVVMEGDLMTFYVNNIVDDGKTSPLKPTEIKDYEQLFHLQFHFPNVWQNFISDKFRIFVAFVPVDEENTVVYVRNYQKLVTLPVLKQLINYLGSLSNKLILNQDKRVVLTQLPKKSELKMDERLIMGDKPIVEYRKRREELKSGKID